MSDFGRSEDLPEQMAEVNADRGDQLVQLELSGPAGWRRVVRAAIRRARALANYLRWRPRFQAFGFGSIIESPHLLTNPRFISIGRGVQIRHGARIEALESTSREPSLAIGDGTSIHMHFHCGAAVRVEIGRNVLIAGRVYITDHDHLFEDPAEPAVHNGKLLASPTIIENDCWLGEGAIVLKGVRVGAGSVIAAGSVVTRDVPAYTIVAGVPARPLRRYDHGLRAWVPVSR
jgi:acetyltransferase-like isoleucine patch superfamily enzyme